MTFKYLKVMLLKPNGKILWKNINWGKKYLDEVRSDGSYIIMSQVEYMSSFPNF